MIRVLLFLVLLVQHGLAQNKEVSITIDDVPNTSLYRLQNFNSVLLDRIGKMNIPVAIFINEKNIYANEFNAKNLNGLTAWLKSELVTAGNHSYSHLNYADTTLEFFQRDILRGEILTTQILNQRPRYFRFPFNSLGEDSLSHVSIKKFLNDNQYINTPFTVESEDWVFNNLYEAALKNNETAKASHIGQQYLEHTLALFQYFENLSVELYGRNIKHIYLCHDNRLNADYLPELVQRLQAKGYAFISLDKALEDNIYLSNEYYTGRYGFSWLYRWEKDEAKRKALMRKEPVNATLQGK